MSWYPEHFSSVVDLGLSGWYIRDELNLTRGVFRYFYTQDEFQEVCGAELVSVNHYNSEVESVVKWSWFPPGVESSVTPEVAARILQSTIEKES